LGVNIARLSAARVADHLQDAASIGRRKTTRKPSSIH
jgi:hypothetical protein